MPYNVPFLTLLYLGCGVLMIGMAAIIWSRRPAPGYFPLTIFLILSGFWIMCSGFEGAADNFTAQDLWAKSSYAGLVSSGVAWLCFTLEYGGSKWVRRPLNVAMVCLIPVAVIVFTLVYDFPGSIWDDISLNFSSAATINLPRMVYLVSSFYQYFLYLFGIIVLALLYRRKPRRYWPQITLILIGTTIPLIGTFIEIGWILPFSKIDITPFYLLFGTVVYCVAFVRFRFLDILPVAYKTLITNIPDGIVVVDLEGIIQEINPAAASMLGQIHLSSINQRLSAVWPKLDQLTRDSTTGRHSEIIAGDSDFPKHLDVSSVLLLNDRQQPVGKLIVLRDISELKAVQLSLQQLFSRERDLNRSLEEEMQKRTQYSRAIVHELRNPLTSIIACTDLLEDQAKEELQRTLIRNIHRSTVNLEQRVNELFELARGEIGLIKIEPARMDMARLVRDIVAEMSPVADSKGIILRSELSAVELPVIADKSRLHQVLTNLIGNSLKFTPAGEIVIRTVLEKDHLKVQVADNGRGIDPEQMQDLFDPYRRKTQEGQGTSGLGIGLALCKIFVELHQGKIWAESTPGQGTIISFTLPCKFDPVRSV
jgi:PAS domain S-box-containing protein